MKNSFFFCLSTILSCLFISNASADTCGKIDVSPTYVHLDVLESGHTVKRLDMGGIRVDGSGLVWKGLCVKPTAMYVYGHGELFTVGMGIGHYTPITDRFSLTPTIGCVYTELRTKINIRPFFLYNLKEHFQSVSPYLSLEATYKIVPGLRFSFIYQYAYSATHTVIKHLGTDNSHSWGPSYAVLLEKDLSDKWSVNIGGAYNIMLTKEKHGLRGYGGKIGVAYWF